MVASLSSIVGGDKANCSKLAATRSVGAVGERGERMGSKRAAGRSIEERRRGTTGSTSSRLVVVSNRLPFTSVRRAGQVRFKRSPGGLVAALDPALSRRGGVWIGWPGAETEDPASAAEMVPPTKRSDKVRYRAVALSRREVSLYYEAFSNRTLWPLFHYFLGRTEIDSASWEVYERVNERFAQATVEESDDDDLIWVHDYQLMRLPRYLRRMAPRRRVAFFLHIPFPSYDVLRILPWARHLMRGLLSCDLVGCQSQEHADHLLTCAEQMLGASIDRAKGVAYCEGRPTAVQAHPIGIDFALFQRLAEKEPGPAVGGERPVEILSVDRLDYTKGIPERLRAIEVFFERHPEYRGRTVFVQLCVPSRTAVPEYKDLKRQVDEAVGRINGRFSDRGWSPIRYLFQSFSQQELVSLYRSASVGLINPLRDGMNLVAKEYVAAQVEGGGVLILSEMAGAAEELKEAVQVNPYDVDQVAEAIRRALVMPEAERRSRMLALRHRVGIGDVQSWVERFVQCAEVAADEGARAAVRGMQGPVDVLRRRLQPWLAARPMAALFLDYDGTLTPIVSRPENALLSSLARRLLRRALRARNLDVVIVSGRSLADVQEMVGIPGLTYVGNHGFEIEGPGIEFHHEALRQYQGAVDRASAELSKIQVKGLWVERKGATLTVHVREVHGEDERRAAERRAAALLRRHKLRVTTGKAIVEGRPPIDWNKGYAVLHVLAQRHGVDWVSRVRALYVGDDVTDEDAFRSLRGLGRSIRVGPVTQTEADMALPDPAAVIELLGWLASGAFEEDRV
jgi:trehalose 6-phosphate synthase/phosphatase